MMHGQLLAVLLALSVQAEEGCGADYTCTCAAVYGCAPISNSTPANMVCCSDGHVLLRLPNDVLWRVLWCAAVARAVQPARSDGLLGVWHEYLC